MIYRLYNFFHQLISRPQERGEYSAGNWQDKVRMAALFLCRDISAGRALEIGCGEGLFLTQLAKAHPGLECQGIDNSFSRIEQARIRIQKMKLDNGQAQCQDGERLDFSDNYFDVVICINVFFNLPSTDALKKILAEANRVTRKSARLIFDIRNLANPLLKIKYKLAPYYDPSVRNLPLNTYSCAQIEGFLKEAGFTVENKLHLGFHFKAFAPLIVYQAKKMITRTPNIAAAYNFKDILSAIKLANDPEVIDRFAGSLNVFLGAQFVYPVNSGVSAFYLILESLKQNNIRKEVILPAYTAGSLVVAVKKAGLKPVLCDISLSDFNLDTKVLNNVITEDTLAVVAVHMFGLGMKSISQIKMSLPTGVTLIEDCAQAFGSRIKDKPVGSLSDISFFSFNRGKNFPLYSGGCIQVTSSDLSDKIKLLYQQLPENRGVGILTKITAFYFATRPYIYGLAYQAISCFRDTIAPNDFKVCRISRIQAGLGISCLEKIDDFLRARSKKGKSLIRALNSETGLILPCISEDDYPVFNQVPVIFKDQAQMGIIEKKLRHNGVEASRVYKKPLHHMFELGYKADDFPNANYLADHLLALPVHHLVSEQNIARMIEIIKETLNS